MLKWLLLACFMRTDGALLFRNGTRGSGLRSTYKCVTQDDCELLGECNTATGKCNCFSGFTGPSCAQVDLKPTSATTAAVMAAWPPAGGYGGGRSDANRAYGWGFSVAPDRSAGSNLLHAIANVGCYGDGKGGQHSSVEHTACPRVRAPVRPCVHVSAGDAWWTENSVCFHSHR